MSISKLDQAIVIGEELAIRFIDGMEIYLPLPYLRVNCPCASCQQKRDAMRSSGVAGLPVQPAGLSTVDVVGGYAVRLVWSDGHGSGIYSFDFLIELEERLRDNPHL